MKLNVVVVELLKNCLFMWRQWNTDYLAISPAVNLGTWHITLMKRLFKTVKGLSDEAKLTEIYCTLCCRCIKVWTDVQIKFSTINMRAMREFTSELKRRMKTRKSRNCCCPQALQWAVQLVKIIVRYVAVYCSLYRYIYICMCIKLYLWWNLDICESFMRFYFPYKCSQTLKFILEILHFNFQFLPVLLDFWIIFFFFFS